MIQNPIVTYLQSTSPEKINPAFLSFLSGLYEVSRAAPEVASGIVREFKSQRENLKLIASENYSSLSTQLAMGNLLTDKYAEGNVGRRFYAGCDSVDDIERLAAQEACRLFDAEHAYVQPHSGADANLIAFWAILSAKVERPAWDRLGITDGRQLTKVQWEKIRESLGNQRLLALDYYSGGHLTHGYLHNVSARMFDVHSYAVDRETGLLDYDAIANQALEIRPLILLAGYSAYPRRIDFERMRKIADQCGAVLMADIAHFAGLVAGKVFEGKENPVPYADVITTTTHKTLRGPRGALILCKKEYAEYVDKGCPMVMGGPLPHVMAAKAVALLEANKPEFKVYARHIVENARHLAAECLKLGLTVVTGGTDNHLLLINVNPLGLTGRQAESALRECGITLNRNSLPFDPNGPWYTSGLRLGTPAVTTLGMGHSEMAEIAGILSIVLQNTKPASGNGSGWSKAKYRLESNIKRQVQERVGNLLSRYSVYPEFKMEYLLPFINGKS
ncbi:MAG: glycine hydroxymethyltransferase [Desulfobacteraceae bacterium]|nr:MAG: glycine hydroxymethyltransferase [Desulfobacteraceae bacterium]